ncbi:MAG: hypothetical protein WAS55_08840 [Saprospiraceae bacterium]
MSKSFMYFNKKTQQNSNGSAQRFIYAGHLMMIFHSDLITKVKFPCIRFSPSFTIKHCPEGRVLHQIIEPIKI